jgi:hypothetical protein
MAGCLFSGFFLVLDELGAVKVLLLLLDDFLMSYKTRKSVLLLCVLLFLVSFAT